MPSVLEEAIGAIDGVNRVYQVRTDYRPGTVRVFTAILQHDDCVTELGGRTIELDFAPVPGDIIHIYYDSIA